MCFIEKKEKIITSIVYPNNIEDANIYDTKRNCDEIRPIFKNWEMAAVWWFEIIKDWKIIAEIKESICNIYYD